MRDGKGCVQAVNVEGALLPEPLQECGPEPQLSRRSCYAALLLPRHPILVTLRPTHLEEYLTGLQPSVLRLALLLSLGFDSTHQRDSSRAGGVRSSECQKLDSYRRSE